MTLVPGRTFCSKCGGVVRSPNHVCNPGMVKKYQTKILPLKKRMEKST